MPLSGGGVKSRVNDFTNNQAANINPTAVQFDAEFDDADACFNLVWWKDGRNAPTADMPMGGFKLEDVGDAVLGTDALNAQTAALRFSALNASLAVSVGSSALTVALKTAAGTEPAAATPVQLQFRSATAATGTLTPRSVVAANSIVINSTATMGASNGVAFSLWAVAFDDGGTIRLSLINALSGVSTYALAPHGIASSTQEDNSADSAHVFYTDGAAVTNKPYVVLARLIWSSGLATAGTWDAVPSVIVPYGPGVKLPGQAVQTAVSQDSAVATGTTVIPIDDTIPQNTEGNQFMTQALTPTVAANLLRVVHNGYYASSTASVIVNVALFQDTTANALYAQPFARNASAGDICNVNFEYVMLASTTSATTFKIRAGIASAGTVTFNGAAGGRYEGGVGYSRLEAVEIVA